MFAWALISLGMLVMGIHGEVASEAYSKNSFTKFLVNQGPTPLVPNEFILDSLMAQVKQMQAAKGNNDGTTDAGVPEESKVTPAEAPFKLRGTGYTYNVKSRAGVINSGNIVGYYDKRTRRIIDGNLVTRRSGHYMLKEKSMLKNPIQMVVPLYAPGLELIKYRLSSNKQEGGKSTFTQDKNPMQIPINKMNTFDRIILNTIPNEKIDLDGAIIWTSYLGPDFCQGHRAGSKLVNPIDSSKFVVCHAYDSYEIMSCPEGLVFIESIGRCEYSA